MAKNFIQDGETIDYQNKSGDTVLSGDIVEIGSIVGVAITDIGPKGWGAVMVRGVFSLPKKSGDAVTAGAKVYSSGDGKVQLASSSTPAGIAWADADASATTVPVKLN